MPDEMFAALKQAAQRNAARLDALRRTDLQGPSADPTFDRLAQVASRLLSAPVSLVSLVEADRQVFKGMRGLPEPWASRRQTPISHSFCRHVADSGRPLIVDDAREHPLVCHNPAVSELGVVAYLGIPLNAPGGQTIGSLCAIDHAPHSWSDDDIQTMTELAAVVSKEIALRHDLAELRRDATWHRLRARAIAELVASPEAAPDLARVAPLLVPEVADRCLFDVPDDHRPARLLEREGAAESLEGLLGPAGEDLRFEVIQTGRPRLLPDPSDAGDGVGEAMEDAGIVAMMIVPLVARGQEVGTMALLAVDSGDRFVRTDLARAEEFGAGVAGAISDLGLWCEAAEARGRAARTTTGGADPP